MPINKCIDFKKMWYMCTIEYYLAMRKVILPFATTWLDLEHSVLSKVSQKNKY